MPSCRAMIQDALDELARTESLGFGLRDLSDVPSIARDLATEIADLVQFELDEDRRAVLQREANRYATRTRLATPFVDAALQFVSVSDPDVVRHYLERAQAPHDDVLNGLEEAITGHLAVHYVSRAVDESEIDTRALHALVKAYRQVALAGVRDGLSFQETQVLTSLMISALDSCAWQLSDYDQVQFYLREVKRDAALASSLMKHYRRWIKNGADHAIQQDIDEAKNANHWNASGDPSELGVLFGTLLGTPYTMLYVIREHDPDRFNRLVQQA